MKWSNNAARHTHGADGKIIRFSVFWSSNHPILSKIEDVGIK